jgi:hypothetical protein
VAGLGHRGFKTAFNGASQPHPTVTSPTRVAPPKRVPLSPPHPSSQFESMANGSGGRAPAPARVPPCPTEQHGFVSSLLVLLRQMDARVKASAVERERLLTEIELLKREQSRRLEMAQDSIQEVRGFPLYPWDWGCLPLR